ncbi:TIGR02206 family membrane protein [Peribacillus alkalitolerans]|uniref:YwaF family protein n=1 Tax=Peribacillus alkalitolerans TaxID=1550385 RepID=UPI0013D2855C|nr:TIGR02206 family membrane protein [Peribacillus alkalitolerans]
MFSVTEMRDFEMFSMTHILTFIIFLTACFFFVYYRKKLKPYQSIIKWTLFSILLACEITHQIWVILNGVWEVNDLPLQLCSLSTFLALFLFLKNSNKVFNLLFFIGLIPAILSMVTPEIAYQFPHYRFIKYFLHHSAIPLSVLYFIIFEGYRVPRKAVLTSYLTLNIIAVPIFILNKLLGTNFFYLASPTEAKTILSFFGNGIMYYINLEIVAIIVFIITYIPMQILQKKEFNQEVAQISKDE